MLAEGLKTCYEVLRGAYLQALVPALTQDASSTHAEAALFATRVVALDAGRRACLKTGSPTAKNAICRACSMTMEVRSSPSALSLARWPKRGGFSQADAARAGSLAIDGSLEQAVGFRTRVKSLIQCSASALPIRHPIRCLS